MDFIPFNSRLTYHKYPFGAVRVNTEVIFRFILPAGFWCKGASLITVHDDKTESAPFYFEHNQQNGEAWWRCSYTPKESGLYFYKMKLDTGFGDVFITKADLSLGTFSPDGDLFQLTVYSDDFKTPDKIKGSVIYQIFPDRFCYSGKKKESPGNDRIIRDDWGSEPLWEPDENGRITKYDFFCGDFSGIESRLDYIKSLGVGYIYLNPIFSAASNHRYDTADYENPDYLLGTKEDFAHLCKSAAGKGIDIILDGVFSHTGSDSKYFNKEGNYGTGGAYNDKESPYFSWYKFKKWPDEYESWWGVDILPEIDETNDSYIKYIETVLEEWQNLGAGGWRLDVADELPDKFLDALRIKVKSVDKDAVIIGEVWEDASNKISYGERRRYLEGRQLDSVMNYPFANAMLDFAITGIAEGFNDKIAEICENYPKCVVDCLMNHIGTHDTCRVLNRLGTLDNYESSNLERYKGGLDKNQRESAVRLLKMLSSIQFTLPGVPSVYYGDEAGADGGVDPYNRGCYPYGKEDAGLLAHYRLLGKIRHDHPAFIDGDFIPVSSVMGCVCFMREGRGERIITVANNNSHPIDYVLPYDGFLSLTGNDPEGKTLFVDREKAEILWMKCDL